jgi:tetratricopeptide (TPR) repeat protein
MLHKLKPTLFPANKPTLGFLFALLLITFIALSPCLSLGFVDWDDPGNLLQNPQLAGFDSTWSWKAVASIFSSSTGGNYNPLSIFTYAIEKYFFAPDPASAPFIFHFNNLWMHLVSTSLVFFISRKLGLSNVAAFVGALFFGIHPMRVESVAWVTERKDVLYGLFYLLALNGYINYVSAEASKKRYWYILTIAFAVFSALSKVQFVALPLSMVAVDFFLQRRWYSFKILMLEKLPWWLMALAVGATNLYFLSKEKVLGGTMTAARYSFIDKLAVGAYSYANYLVKWIAPFKLSHYHEFPVRMPVWSYAAIVIVPVLVIMAMVWAWKRGYTYIIFGCAFFTVNVMFMLQIVPAGDAFLAERFTYIAYFGLFFIVAKAFQDFVVKMPQLRSPLIIVMTVYIGTFTFITYGQTQVWKNTVSLYSHYIKNFGKSPYGYKQLGVHYIVRATSGEDVEFSKEQLMQLSMEKFQEANLRDSVNNRPSKEMTEEIFENLGIAYGVSGQHDAAMYYFSREIEIAPRSKDAYTNRAYEHSSHKEYEDAILDYNQALTIDPNNAEAVYARGNCFFGLGDMASALTDINRAISLNNREPKYYIARAIVYKKQDNMDGFRSDISFARSLGGDVSAYEDIL